MSNRRPGVFDSGATHTENGIEFREADMTLSYALTLQQVLEKMPGVEVVMTRSDNVQPCPVWSRAETAHKAGADALVSIHVNDADSDSANGLEVLWRRPIAQQLAENLQRSLVKVTGFKDRGIKARPDLSVLSFSGVAVLIELGFIAHDQNRSSLLSPDMRTWICRTIAADLHGFLLERTIHPK
jgi:N-acetylmuramoyl-L-alanine amidase